MKSNKAKIYKFINCIVIIILLYACSDEQSINLDKVIVEGYLYANQPVKDIRISKMLPYGSKSHFDPIPDAAVYILHNDQYYKLTPKNGQTGRYYDATEQLIVKNGEQYKLIMNYKNNNITSTTKVPLAIKKLTINYKQFIVDSLQFNSANQLVITWKGNENDYYFSSIECVEKKPEKISRESSHGDNAVADFNDRAYPTLEHFIYISERDVQYYGRHKITLFSVLPEYAELYDLSIQQVKEIRTNGGNINNGYGIFTAINRDSLFFEVVKIQR